jgi:UDP-glucose 4-epimerase
MGDLVAAMQSLFDRSGQVQVIGTRHGEKLFETLVSREEMARAQDLGEYYRIPADSRDLNYAKYFSEGELTLSNFEDYTSHNTKRLTVCEVVEALKKIPVITEILHG